MIKLAKYLKPFLHLVLIGITLLFIQAFSDLNLPHEDGEYRQCDSATGGGEEGGARGAPGRRLSSPFDGSLL